MISSTESNPAHSEFVLLTCIKHKLIDHLKKYKYIIADDSKYSLQLRSVFSHILEQIELVKSLKTLGEAEPDFDEIFSYMLESPGDTHSNSDITERTGFALDSSFVSDFYGQSLLYQTARISLNKFQKNFSIDLLSNGVDVSVLLSLNPHVIKTNQKVKDVIFKKIKAGVSRDKKLTLKSLLTIESKYSFSAFGDTNSNTQDYLQILLSFDTQTLVKLVQEYELDLCMYKDNSNNILH